MALSLFVLIVIMFFLQEKSKPCMMATGCYKLCSFVLLRRRSATMNLWCCSQSGSHWRARTSSCSVLDDSVMYMHDTVPRHRSRPNKKREIHFFVGPSCRFMPDAVAILFKNLLPLNIASPLSLMHIERVPFFVEFVRALLQVFPPPVQRHRGPEGQPRAGR